MWFGSYLIEIIYLVIINIYIHEPLSNFSFPLTKKKNGKKNFKKINKNPKFFHHNYKINNSIKADKNINTKYNNIGYG